MTACGGLVNKTSQAAAKLQALTGMHCFVLRIHAALDLGCARAMPSLFTPCLCEQPSGRRQPVEAVHNYHSCMCGSVLYGLFESCLHRCKAVAWQDQGRAVRNRPCHQYRHRHHHSHSRSPTTHRQPTHKPSRIISHTRTKSDISQFFPPLTSQCEFTTQRDDWGKPLCSDGIERDQHNRGRSAGTGGSEAAEGRRARVGGGRRGGRRVGASGHGGEATAAPGAGE